MNRLTKNQFGYTIVELLVAITFIGITTAAVTQMFINIHQLQQLTRFTDSATRAAQAQIEVLRNDQYATLTPGQEIDFTNDLPSDLPGEKSGTVEVSQPSNDLRRVDVTVSYTYGEKERSVKLSSLIGVIGITQ